jgi:hypothetical protein
VDGDRDSGGGHQAAETSRGERTSIKLTAAHRATIEIGFEPIGTSFTLKDDEWIVLELPIDAVGQLEFASWPNGLAVWVPFPGDYVVYDSSGNELDRL